MTIFESVRAIDVLYRNVCGTKASKHPKLYRLCQDIEFNHKCDAFEGYITMEVFPHGCDEEEFIRTLDTHEELVKNIRIALGI